MIDPTVLLWYSTEDHATTMRAIVIINDFLVKGDDSNKGDCDVAEDSFYPLPVVYKVLC
jgi:hypothetical protein